MKQLLTVLLLTVMLTGFAQQQTYDLVTYLPPGGWKPESIENIISYTITDNNTGSWCRVSIVKSTVSKGTIEQDFTSEWNDLVVKNYTAASLNEAEEVTENDGWKFKKGYGSFTFNNAPAFILLTTISGYDRCISIVAVTNSDKYNEQVQQFVETISLQKPVPQNSNSATQKTETAATTGGYTFTTTNFDDGWVSTVQEDWVQVTKGATQVLLHYEAGKVDVSAYDYQTIATNAWNALVAPRYSNLQNFFLFKGTMDYQRSYFVSGDVTETGSGKNVQVVLFKRGNSGWIEIITADKNSFVQQFGIDIGKVDYYADSKIWEPLLQLTRYNKFAVAATDLTGKWTNNFSSMQQYVNAYTGANAGMNTYSSNEQFEFMAGNSYKWEVTVASGFVGNINFKGVKSNGTLTLLNDWQIKFSDIEGKPKTYPVQFSCIKGARILWIGETGFGKME